MSYLLKISTFLVILPVFAAGCVWGPKMSEFGPAQTPFGIEVRIVTENMPANVPEYRGELLAVRATGLIVLLVDRVVHVPFLQIRRAAFKDQKVLQIGVREPNPEKLEQLRLLSRYPQGLEGEVLDNLLARHGQSDIETLTVEVQAQVQPEGGASFDIEPRIGFMGGGTPENDIGTGDGSFVVFGARVQKYRNFQSSFVFDFTFKPESDEFYHAGSWFIVSAGLGRMLVDRDVNGFYGMYVVSSLGIMHGSNEIRYYNYIPENDEPIVMTRKDGYTGLTLPISVAAEFELARQLLLRITGTLYFGITPWRDDRTGINDFWGPGFALFPGIAILF